MSATLRLATTAPALGLLALSACTGPPARLVAGRADPGVVNNVRPVQLPVRLPVQVLDAAGHVLPDTGVRYRWASGAPVSVSARGVVTCARPGDAVVRASIAALATRVVLRCRPVREARATIWNDVVLGDSARELPVAFIGVDGRPVTLLAARVRVEDSTVATLDGLRIRPLAPGRTHVWVTVGDREASGEIHVFAPVRTLEGLRPDQRFVAAPVRLTRGEALRWPLPVGLVSLVFLPGPAAQPAPTLTVAGAIMCMPALGPGVYRTHCRRARRGRDGDRGAPRVARGGDGRRTRARVGRVALNAHPPSHPRRSVTARGTTGR